MVLNHRVVHHRVPSAVVDSSQSCDLAPFLGDWSQSVKLSDIKPPLSKFVISFDLFCVLKLKNIK